MRGNAEECELVAAPSLEHALRELARTPGVWTPLAGGTELMVAHAAGRLSARKLISLSALTELQILRNNDNWLSIGAGVTFGELRRHQLLAKEFPLLARAATWIGSIANQNRATIAGNIVNGSPAADAPPALLVYDAEIELISERGARRIPYSQFHLGYKKNVMAPDELVLALHLPRRFNFHSSYLRKVGARKAMAITKVALAATAILSEDRSIKEIRLAAASLADRPIRVLAAEAALQGKLLDSEVKSAARRALIDEVRPIDDIRSTADYRRMVAVNLLDEFLSELEQTMIKARCTNSTLEAWNPLEEDAALLPLLSCCSSARWAKALVAMRPFSQEQHLYDAADAVWSTMQEADWHEAFRAHPRVGDRTPAHASEQSAAWSTEEQSAAAAAETQELHDLARLNEQYEHQFGFTYIVCATGKSAGEMLQILRTRLGNDRHTELGEAAEQQRQITQLRLHKWLAS